MQLAFHASPVTSNPPSGCPIEDNKSLMALVALRRDVEAFRALFLYFGPRLKAFMIKSGAEPALAEDLVQDVMVTVWRKAQLYKPDRGSVSAWIFAVARNARIDRLRSRSSRPYDDIDDLEVASDEESGEDTVYASQISDKIGVALADLPQDQRTVIELAYLHDVPQSEIASKLNVPLGTVKSRMRLAYRKLRIALGELQ